MIYLKGILFLMVDVFTRLLSVIVPYSLIEYKTGKKTSRMAKAVLFVIGLLGYWCIHYAYIGDFNALRTAKRILFGDFTCQSIFYLPVSAGIEAVILIVLSVLLVSSDNMFPKKLRIQIFSKNEVIEKCGFRHAMARRLFFVYSSIFLFALVFLTYLSLSGIYEIQITEIQPGSEVVVKHEVYGNYIELYNNGYFDCEIKKLYLSDDEEYLKKLLLVDTKLQKKSYMIVDVDNDIFSLKKSGGQTFYLSDEFGNILSYVNTEKVRDNKSYSLMADGKWCEYDPSPRMDTESVELWENELVYSKKVDCPKLSIAAGFYDDPFYLKISADENCRIFYTTDGSLPTLDSAEYDGEIYVYDKSLEESLFLSEKRVVLNYNDEPKKVENVDKAFVIRAIAVNKDGVASRPVTATYFIDKDKYQKYATLSVVADPEQLYGEDGVFVTGKDYDDWYLNGKEGDEPLANFLGSGKGYEIPANFEFFGDEISFSQDIGLRVAGGSTRNGSIKKLSFYARKEYSGKKVFDQQIFEGIDNHKLSIGGAFINPIVMELVKNRDVAVLGNIRVNVFVNGEYYQQTSLIERYNEEYFSQHYDVDEKDVIIMDEDEMYEDSEAHREWDKIYEFLKENNLSDSDAYRTFGEIIDIQSYIDYLCIRTYIDDSDYNERKNFVMWKTRGISNDSEYSDGKWRWALFDLDFMENGDYERYGYDSQAQKNSFEIVGDFVGGYNAYMQPIFLALYENDEFRKQFRKSFLEIAKTTFAYDKVVDCIENYGADLSEYDSAQELDYYLDFFKDREKYIIPYMEEKFGN